MKNDNKSLALPLGKLDKLQHPQHFSFDLAALDIDFSIRFLQYNELMIRK